MNKKIYKSFLVISLVFACSFIYCGRAETHSLWLNVDNHYPNVGEKTNVKVVFGHNFPHYDILISKDALNDFSYLSPDGQKKEIVKTWEDRQSEKKGALAGEVTLDQKGTYIITAYRKKKGDKEHVPSEKYGKSIIIVDKGNENVSRFFGHRIEIIPLKNPSEVKGGDILPIKILFEGKPLSTYIYATYAGYYSENEPFPVFTRSNKKGVAYVKISQPGIWQVVCGHKVDFSASLTFEIK